MIADCTDNLKCLQTVADMSVFVFSVSQSVSNIPTGWHQDHDLPWPFRHGKNMGGGVLTNKHGKIVLKEI